ncbi:MAG: hypothetical protein KY455_05400, partial [Euryarchaeota archaeon]|nr:hypothetical protein [Euryarchaeota archaeon]
LYDDEIGPGLLLTQHEIKNGTVGVHAVVLKTDRHPAQDRYHVRAVPFDIRLNATEIVDNVSVAKVTAPRTGHTFDVSANDHGWFSKAMNMSLGAFDGSGFNYTTTHLAVNAGQLQTYSGPVLLNQSGIHEIDYWSTLSDGRVERTRSALVPVDLDNPNGMILTPKEGHVTLVANVSVPHAEGKTVVGGHIVLEGLADDATSQVDEVRFLLDGEQIGTAEQRPDGVYALQWDATEETPGPHVLTMEVVDHSGRLTTQTRLVEIPGQIGGLKALMELTSMA